MAQNAFSPSTPDPDARPPVRILFPVLLVAIYWAFIAAVYSLQLAMFTRFISRMIALGVFLLVLLGWWSFNRQFSRRDRWLAVGFAVLCWVVTSLISDPSVKWLGTAFVGVPYFATAAVAWLAVSRRSPLSVQWAGYCAAAILSFGYLALLRWDGLDGGQHNEMNWRWSPTKEQISNAAIAARPAPSGEVSHPLVLRDGDWPEFRGSNRDGVVSGVRLATNWKEHPPELLWRQRVGAGWSSMIVVDDHLFTQEQRGDSEAVVCYDAATGKEAWVYQEPDRFFEGLSGAGPRATPTFRDNRIYSLGAKGKLSCLDAESGRLVWSQDIAKAAQADVPQWGFSASPLVVEGLVLVFAGGEHERSLLAYRADSGDLAWANAGGPTSYSSPQLVSLDGQRQVIMPDSKALVAVGFEQGKELWNRPTNNVAAMPMLQVHSLGANELLVPSDPGIARIEVRKQGDQWTAVDRWVSEGVKPSFNDFAVHEGHLYGLDDGILCCADLETGKRVWKGGRYGHGQLLLLPDQGALLILGETGEVALAATNPKRHEELARFQAIEGKTWNHPVLAHGRLFVRNGEEMACYKVRQEGEAAAESK